MPVVAALDPLALIPVPISKEIFMHQQAVISVFLESLKIVSGADGVYVYQLRSDGAASLLIAWAGEGHPHPSIMSVSLVHAGAKLGVLKVYRTHPATPAELAFLSDLSLPLGALLALTAENEKLAQQLADRKILDRAKGLLQARLSWTEEEAYLHLRRISRQRRTAMREIAREVIEKGELHLVEEARHAS
jgi:hypothetical protein